MSWSTACGSDESTDRPVFPDVGTFGSFEEVCEFGEAGNTWNSNGMVQVHYDNCGAYRQSFEFSEGLWMSTIDICNRCDEPQWLEWARIPSYINQDGIALIGDGLSKIVRFEDNQGRQSFSMCDFKFMGGPDETYTTYPSEPERISIQLAPGESHSTSIRVDEQLFTQDRQLNSEFSEPNLRYVFNPVDFRALKHAEFFYPKLTLEKRAKVPLLPYALCDYTDQSSANVARVFDEVSPDIEMATDIAELTHHAFTIQLEDEIWERLISSTYRVRSPQEPGGITYEECASSTDCEGNHCSFYPGIHDEIGVCVNPVEE